MSELITGVVIGAVIPAIMFIGSKIFDFLKLKSEEKRWYGEHLLKLRIDTLRDLQLIMEESFFIYNKYLNLSPINEEEYFKNVAGKSEKYRDAKVLSEIYLTQAQDGVLSTMLGQLRLADKAIADSIRLNTGVNGLTPPFGWGEFLDAHTNAQNSLKELLNPNSFRNYLDNI